PVTRKQERKVKLNTDHDIYCCDYESNSRTYFSVCTNSSHPTGYHCSAVYGSLVQNDFITMISKRPILMLLEIVSYRIVLVNVMKNVYSGLSVDQS
ncbi:MAG: hypothetical protein ACJ708_05935, partial [Nitrososphaeraceae archaeon]